MDDRVARAQMFMQTRKPVEVNVRELATDIDGHLAELYQAEYEHAQRRDSYLPALHREAGHKKDMYGRWDGSAEDAVRAAAEKSPPSRAYAEYRKQARLIAQIELEQAEGEAVYMEHRWTRAFLVTNDNGHVHSSMHCSTCTPTTRYEWLNSYSGADEAEIVGDAGETACTVCYKSAPAEVLNRPANLRSKTREEKDAAKAERDAAKAERERKRIEKAVTKDGSPLRVPATQHYESNYDRGGELTNETTASSLWVDIEMEKSTEHLHMRPTERHYETQRLIATALAEKHGRTYEEQVAVLQTKTAAKVKREEKERAKWGR